MPSKKPPDGGKMAGAQQNANPTDPKPVAAHVIVVGNDKGGSGKSTVAIHVAIALLKAGARVATLDLDSRQRTFTHYVERRRAWAKTARLRIELPNHNRLEQGSSSHAKENEAVEFSAFSAALSAVEHGHDFVVIDTPGADTYLTRLAHAMADTLITPVNDSMLDLDVIGTVDPATLEFTGPSHYAGTVREARRQRRDIDGRTVDWIVVRNRLTAAATRGRPLVAATLEAMSLRLGFRHADGFAERTCYRDFFPRGLTAVDTLDPALLGETPSLTHLAAQEEVCALMAALQLPGNERGRRLFAARAQWATARQEPLELHDVLAE
jgi:chromosome partitioning protein